MGRFQQAPDSKIVLGANHTYPWKKAMGRQSSAQFVVLQGNMLPIIYIVVARFVRLTVENTKCPVYKSSSN